MGQTDTDDTAETDADDDAPAGAPNTPLEHATAHAKYKIWLINAHEKFAEKAAAKAKTWGLDPDAARETHVEVLQLVADASE